MAVALETRNASLYTGPGANVIRSFRHKGSKLFYDTGSVAGIIPSHKSRLADQLARLDQASCPENMIFPGWAFHPLVGDLRGRYAVKVSGNWRLTFAFENGNAVLVDYQDYH
jgi:proteic killer suppression protein